MFHFSLRVIDNLISKLVIYARVIKIKHFQLTMMKFDIFVNFPLHCVILYYHFSQGSYKITKTRTWTLSLKLHETNHDKIFFNF